MSKNSTNIKERILYLAEIKEDSKQNFFRKTSLKYSNFTGKSKNSDLSSGSLAEILLIYPDLNPEWLLTGKGSMLKNEQNKPPPDPGSAIEKEKLELENTQLKEKISLQHEIIELLRDKLALYEEKYRAGKEKKAG